MNEESKISNASSRIANLPPEKLALLALRLKKKEGAGASQRVAPRAAGREALPLSFAQQRLWFLDQLDAGHAVYISPSGVRLKGRLDIAILERTLEEIVKRHEVLRTSFPAVDGKPMQVVAAPGPLRLAVTDFSGWAETEREAEVRRLVMEDAHHPFDLAQCPLFRVSVLRLGPEEHVVLLTMHHIISDWWSMTVLIREVSQVYEAFSRGAPSPLAALPSQYADFARWQREQLQGEVLEAHLSYWRHQLSGVLPLLNLPADRKRPAAQTFRGDIEHFVVPKSLSESITALSLRERVTLFMTLLAAFNALLARYTGQDDIIIGTDIANRTHSATESLIGFFINQLVLRTDLAGDPSFRDLLRRVRDVALGAYAHQDLPFEHLVAQLQPERSLSHTPLFQVKFVLQNAPAESMELRGLTLETVDLHNGTVGFDLILTVLETADGLRGTFEYSTDLFEAAKIKRLCGHFQTLLQSVVANPEARLSQLEILTKEERRQLLVEFNDTDTGFLADKCIHELFEAHAAAMPDTIAIIHEGEQVTYEQLNRRANQVAHYLRAMGIGPEVRVGIFMARSVELVVGLLGILKAGGAYVPFDPSYPLARLSMMLEDAQVPVLIAQESLAENLPALWSQIICLDSDWEFIAGHSQENPSTAVTPDNAAYVIYTSGTTGRPKGVVVEHRGVANLVKWQASNFQITNQSRVSQFASYSFDAAVGESFMALLNGATLVMLNREELSASGLISSINDDGLTVVVLVPSILKEMNPDSLINPEVAIVAVGEACPPDLALKWSRKCNFMNAYGPTEYTVYSHLWKVEEEFVAATNCVPIGQPIHNTKTYILDAHLNTLPIGVDGEIYISGPGIARGYLNRAAITSEKFIPNRFHDYDLFIEDGELPVESARTEIAAFKDERQSAPPPGNRKQISWSKNISTETVFSLVRGLDTDLIDKTQSLVKNLRQDSSAYQAFCRYLIEGFNHSYASSGINEEVLRRMLPFDDLRGLKGIDLGFGNAEVLRQLAGLGAQMKGLDFNPFFVKKGRDYGLDVRMARIDVAPELFIAESRLEEASHDFAISTLLLDRLEEPKNYLRNLFLVLKENGRFAIQTLLPIIGVDDGEVQDPIIYTPEPNRIASGKSVEEDKLSLIALLHEYGGEEMVVHQLPYVVSSRDGIQEYTVWSFTGVKKARPVPVFVGDHYVKMYKTGDLGRYWPDGKIEFRGRIDNQVKVRGFRIELGDIESSLLDHQQVKDCVVSAVEKQGQKRLVAYVVGVPDEPAPVAGDLQQFLKQKLPEYMVPSAWVMLDSIPLTANGKVDQQRLPPPGEIESTPRADFVAPHNQVESWLADAWGRVLGLKRVSIHDNIFDLGGDSILIIQILAKLNQVGLYLTVNQFFKHQTIAELARVASTTRTVQIDQALVTGTAPLVPVQHWFFAQDLPASHHYNQSILLQLKEVPNVSHLEESVQQLLRHHDALRLRFQRTPQGWRQFNAESEEHQVFSRVDLSQLAETEDSSEISETARRVQTTLDLSEGPLLRVVYFDFGARRHGLVLIVVHHLVVDGVSWRILIEDLQTAYQQLQRQEVVQLPPKTTSFKSWAEQLAQYARSAELHKELDYWRNRPQNISPLPIDYQGGANLNSNVTTISALLSREETKSLLEHVPAVYRTQINEVLLTGLVEAVGAWTGERALLVELEGHGREELFAGVDVTRTVGWFTSLYPVWLDVRETPEVGEALKQVKEQLRGVPRRGIGYGVWQYLCEEGAAQRGTRLGGSAEVSFNYLGQLDQVLGEEAEFEAATESSGPERDERQKRPYLIEVNARVAGGQMQLNVSYSGEIHARDTMERFTGSYMAELRRIIEHCRRPDVGGYTPSDFPLAQPILARLNGAELDELLGQTRDVEDVYPLTPLQQGMLFHSLYAPHSHAYFNQMNCTVRRGLEVSAFVRAWQQVIEQHPVLRTGFVWEGLDEPLQVVRRQVKFPLVEQDWRALSQAEQSRRLEIYLQDDRQRGFDLSEGPLMRLALFRLSEESYDLVWSFHHLLMDGWTVALLLKDLFTAYESLCQQETKPLERRPPFSEYVNWLSQQDMAKAEEFWRRSLKGFTAVTQLGNARAIGRLELVGMSERFSEQSVSLSEAHTKALHALARQHRLTLNTVLQGAWGILLSQYSGEDDVVFGTVVSGRPPALAGAETMIGLFINTLPVRVTLEAEQRLGAWLEQLQEQQAELRQYEYSPLADVQGWSELGRGRPLFESLLVFENYPVDESLKEQGGSLEIEKVETQEQTDYPLTVVVAPVAELTIRASFDERRFDAASIARMLNHLKTLLETMAGETPRRLRELALLSEAERQQVLITWNQTAINYPDQQTLPQLFEQQAARTPTAIAVVAGQDQLSYRELNERANQVAHHLRRLGVGAEVTVGVSLERSAELVVGLLGVLKAGGAYVPLDPSYPRQRLSFMLEDARVSALLTKEEFLPAQPSDGIKVVCLDADGPLIANESRENPSNQTTPLHPAYVIYTSGSTGRPKGVIGLHRGAVNRLHWMWERYPFAEEICCQKTSIGFVDSVWEIFGPLLKGVRLVIIPDDIAKDPHLLVKTLADQRVTRIVLVPSLLRAILESVPDLRDKLPELKYWVTSGEALTGELAGRFQQLMPGRILLNLYGSSEVSADVTGYDASLPATEYATPPIGRPIANTQVYILNRHLEAVPAGVPGEIYVGGDNLARGYLHRPDLTAEKFIPHPLQGQFGERLYRTGDVARWWPDGNIDFLGRTDHQVKLRGYRIELGEIEAALKQHEDVREAVVLASSDEAGGQSLVAYYVSHRETALSAGDLRAHLRTTLLENMVPAAFVRLDAMPLTPSGKVNRNALPKPDYSRADDLTLVLPRTEAERVIARIWQQALGVEKVGIEDNFFDLGGHSLLLVKVQSLLKDEFQQDVSLVEMFQYSTVSALAEHLSVKGGMENSSFDQSMARGMKRRARRNRHK